MNARRLGDCAAGSAERMDFRDTAAVERRGFTIVEVLMVLGILCFLLAVLAPVLLNARETSRRAQCADNLRKITQALMTHHDTEKSFPAGQVAAFTKDESGMGVNNNTKLRYADPLEARHQQGQERPGEQGTSWIVKLLPKLDQSQLAQAWKADQNVIRNGADANAPARAEIPLLYCPSRRSGMNVGAYPGADRVDASWNTGGSDYAACAGSGIAFTDDENPDRQTYWLTAEQLLATAPFGTTIVSPYTQHTSHVGVFGVNTQTTVADIVDGRANVILVAERRLFANGSPNGRRSSDGWAWGGPATMFTTRLAPQPPGADYGRHYDEAGSEHAGGITQVGFADGRVKAISVNIDQRIWNNMGNMRQGAYVPNTGG